MGAFFRVEKDSTLALFAKGVQTLDIVGQVKRKGLLELEVQWRFKLGSHWLTEEQSRQVLQGSWGGEKHPLLLPELRLIQMLPSQATALHDWKRSHKDKADSPSYCLFSLFAEVPVKLDLSPEVAQWRESLCAPPREEQGVKLPDFLRSYQRQGVLWLRHLCRHGCHALLADEMGLGKTIQALALIATWPIVEKPHLIVCPASVVPVWRHEIKTFSPQLNMQVLGNGCDFLTHPEPCIWITSYTRPRQHKALWESKVFGYAILDEAQFIKNPATQGAMACMAIRAQHRIVLTGTPVENRLLDVWTLFRFLLPEFLAERRHFEGRLDREPETVRERLRAQIEPFMLRRTKREVLYDLPPKVEMDLVCPLTLRQRQEYLRLTEQAYTRLGHQLTLIAREQPLYLWSLLMRLRQVCCDPDLLPWCSVNWHHSGKINILVDKTEAILSGGCKIVIFSQFVSFLERVRGVFGRLFPSLPVYELTGRTLDRKQPVTAFQEHFGSAVIAISLRARGTGINLHSADYVFLLDPWWNPAVEAQAIDRVHRIGQQNTVFVYRLITSGTVEERIQQLQLKKKRMFDEVVQPSHAIAQLDHHFRSLNDLIGLSSWMKED